MKKFYICMAATGLFVAGAHAQSAIDAYNISQPDMKGTARFMSMAGAFGALGGDLSSLSQNPAGIGVYRSGDVGFTLNLDAQSSKSTAQGYSYDMSQTKFLLNNIGAVVTLNLPNNTFPNFNIGFTYNKGASFNRKYGGNIPRLGNSMSNYMAAIAESNELTEGDVATVPGYDPYNPGANDYPSPWLDILGYDSYLITPEYDPRSGKTYWYGQWADWNNGTSTSGSGSFLMNEKGSLDEYNIALGGNIANVLYWGMNFDITHVNYQLNSVWAESLVNAAVPNANNVLTSASSDWNLNNFYQVSGTGFNYQLGVIVKPVQELRLGFAFHTPTWYNLTESFGANINYSYDGGSYYNVQTNNGVLAYNDFSFRTPWKFIASAAAVLGNNFIVSFDYEWAKYSSMKFSSPDYGWDNPWYDGWYDWSPAPEPSQGPLATKSSFLDYDDPYYYENQDIQTYYKQSNTFRVGAEFRLTPWFSLRAGYSHVSSPVKSEAKNNKETIYTSGTLPSYRFDNDTNYITGGLGLKHNRFYLDLAYVYKHMDSEYHAYTPDPDAAPGQQSPQAKVSLNNSQVVLTMGWRF